MTREKFDFALERLPSTQWKLFEELASDFLSADFDELRTVARPGGDRGRDAQLIAPVGDETVMIQYSVTVDWRDKITSTVQTVKANFPKVKILIYATNQLIGADADDLVAMIRKTEKVYVDIRDRSWFVERSNKNEQCRIAAERLEEKIANPYLSSRGVLATKAQALTSFEAQAALTYLGLQFEDDSREKGLTRLSFEALVRSALRDTSSESRLSRTDVKARVRALLPSNTPENIDQYVDSALHNLNKRFIRHWTKLDEFCLTHQEKLRLAERLAKRDSQERSFAAEIRDIVKATVALKPDKSKLPIEKIVTRVRRILERFLLSRGEAFVASLKKGQLHQLGWSELDDLIIVDFNDHPAQRTEDLISVIKSVLVECLTTPGVATQAYLKPLADSYTLFAFLLEAPDVQSVITKIFSHGEIWLDTNVILPLIGEELLAKEERRLSIMIKAARDAGLKLYVTDGVLEEIERHMNRCLACHEARPEDWEGRIPFLYSVYAVSGRSLIRFRKWLEEFRGAERPIDDIAMYLEEEFGIRRFSLEEAVDKYPEELRVAIAAVWTTAHESRRGQDPWALDDFAIKRLVDHDVENYVGVIARRQQDSDGPFGYTAWWLTMDKKAYTIEDELEDRLIRVHPPASPVMSPDFLLNYLNIGPLRNKAGKHAKRFPYIIAEVPPDHIPPEFLTLAVEVRESLTDLPERVIRRRVRDALDAAKRRRGAISEGGIAEMERALRQAVSRKPRS